MWKVFIADDEPKIRMGLAQLVESFGKEFEVTGEAEDGQSALERISIELPDILLVDICMPRLNGLEFIEKIQKESVNSIIIIITGHDEFEYAKKAVELPIFEYILKPVDQKELAETIKRAVAELQVRRRSNSLLQWAEEELHKHRSVFLEEFMKDWVSGNLLESDFQQRRSFLSIDFDTDVSLIGLQMQDRIVGGTSDAFKENAIAKIAADRLMEEALAPYGRWFRFVDPYLTAYYVIEAPLPPDFCDTVKDGIRDRLKLHTYCEQLRCPFEYAGLLEAYERIRQTMETHNQSGPFIRKVYEYLEKHYTDNELNLDELATHLAMSAGYVSRLIKQHTGYGFTEFTNRFRIAKAIGLLSDPEKKIYEIAEEVGYSSQHYFSRAFKRITGSSPMDYRMGAEGIL
jgi:two-component system, response regulator YesN